MNDPRMPALLVSHHRPGFYFRVLDEGEVEAGDEIVKVASGPEQMTVAEVDALLYLPGHPRRQLLRALRHPRPQPRLAGVVPRRCSRAESEQRQRGPGRRRALRRPGPGSAGCRSPGSSRRATPSISIRLADPDGAPLPARAPGPVPHAATSSPTAGGGRCSATTPSPGQPGAGFYRITVKREPHGAASGYLHTRLAVGDRSSRGAARHLHPRPDRRARAAAQRRHRRDPGARHAPRAGGGALRPGDLVAARRAQRPRASLRRRGPRAARLAPERARRTCALQPSRRRTTSKAATSTAPAGSPRRLLAELDPPRDAEAYLCGPTPFMDELSAALAAIGLGAAPDPHRAVRARCRPDPGHRRDARAAAPPAGRASPGAARRSSSRAATSPSRGATTTRACSTSPRRATCRSAGRAAPASATPARRRSSPATVDYDPEPVEPPADGSALICCSRPRDDVVLDL